MDKLIIIPILFTLLVSSALSLRPLDDPAINPGHGQPNLLGDRERCRQVCRAGRSFGPAIAYKMCMRACDQQNIATLSDIDDVEADLGEVDNPLFDRQRCRQVCHAFRSFGPPSAYDMCLRGCDRSTVYIYERKQQEGREKLIRECRRRCERREGGRRQQMECQEWCEDKYEHPQRDIAASNPCVLGPIGPICWDD